MKDFQGARTADYINAETNPEAQMAGFSPYLEDRGPVTLRKVLQGTLALNMFLLGKRCTQCPL